MDIRPIISRYDMWSPYTVTTTSGVSFGSGSLSLEKGWQLVAVPVQEGFWSTTLHKHIHDGTTTAKFKNYVLDQITDLYGENVVEVANTFTGDAQKFFSYVVGSTPESSFNNFNLIYSDGLSLEVSGFWIKIIGNDGPYLITWGVQ